MYSCARSRQSAEWLRFVLLSAVICGGLMSSSTAVWCYSFSGSDWLMDMSGQVTAPMGINQSISSTANATNITQSSMTAITIPINVPGFLSTTLDATVNGTHVTASKYIAEKLGPYTYSGVTAYLKGISIHLEGDVTQINQYYSETYGNRAYEVTGLPYPTSYITVDQVLLPSIFGDINMGKGYFNPSAWRAYRGAGAFDVSGTIVLKDFVGSVSGVSLASQLRRVGGLITPKTVSLSSSGDFLIHGVSVGTYDMAFKANHWLQTVKRNVVVSDSAVSLGSIVLTNGDVDGDNEITSTDLSVLGLALGSVPGDSTWRSLADLDGDSEVTSTDLSILGIGLGMSGDN